MLIRNARPIVQNLSLDREGFALTTHHSTVQNFYSDEEVRRVYYAEAEKLLTELTGAIKVVVFDHNVRDARDKRQFDEVFSLRCLALLPPTPQNGQGGFIVAVGK